MLFLTSKKGDKMTLYLTVGLTLGIFITWIGIPIIKTVGLLIYMLSGLLISLTNLKAKGLSKMDKLTIILAGLFTFGVNLFSFMRWPYAGEVRLSLIIPVSLFLITLFSGMIKRKEVGYLTIMNVAFILRLIR